MAIKPVDMQVMLPRISEVARIQGSDQERQAATSQRGEIDAKAMVDADVREVHSGKNAYRVNFRDDKKEDDKNGKKKKNKKGNSDNNRADSSSENNNDNRMQVAYNDEGKKNALSKDLADGGYGGSKFIDVRL